MARLAAVLALLDWTANRPTNAPPPAVITAQHLHAAWELWERYYRPHARAVFDRAGPSDRDRKARQVIGWIRAHEATEISREDVRRDALRQKVNAAGADEVIDALEEAGVLREVDDEEDYRGRGRPARRWQVNPALLAEPAAQIAESPSLPSAAGEVSSSYDDGGVGSLASRPPAKSLAQIAEKQASPDFEGSERGRLAKMISAIDKANSCLLPESAPASVAPRSWISDSPCAAMEWRARSNESKTMTPSPSS